MMKTNALSMNLNNINIENVFHFDDYTDSELLQVLELKLKEQNLTGMDRAKKVAVEIDFEPCSQWPEFQKYQQGREHSHFMQKVDIRHVRHLCPT